MFHFNGAKHTTPNCPIQLSPDFNPSGGANYNRAGKDCKKNARYNIPFFTSEPANRYEEWSINAHEGRPGHHTQVSTRSDYRYTTNVKNSKLKLRPVATSGITPTETINS